MSHHVLIVEDDADARESLAALLETAGYAVTQAQNGEEALRMLREWDVCIVLLDIFMPVMNGWTFLERRGQDPALAGIPVVVITADASATRRAAESGITAALTKPVNHGQLFRLLESHC